VRNQATVLRWQAGELKDTLQRLLHSAGQIESLAIALTEQDKTSLTFTLEQVEEALAQSLDYFMSHGNISYAIAATMKETVITRLREGGAHKG
jgi:hypothetical protein